MSGQNIAEKSKKLTHFICMTNIFLCDLYHLHAGATAVTLPGDSLKKRNL